ncbi:MAG: hypothetical protein AAF849_16505 [Bacteroidota bacterium]
MRIAIVLITIILFQISAIGQSKRQYLKENRYDLNQEILFPQTDFKLIGFGALHGSAKTERAEIRLLKSIMTNNDLSVYVMETDYSIGYFFNTFLKNGDTILLKDLINHYGIRVPQEKSIETYNKWIELYKLKKGQSTNKKLRVYGIDPIVSYKYTFKHIVELLKEAKGIGSIIEIKNQVELDTTDFSPYYDSYSKSILKKFVNELTTKDIDLENPELNHIITNLKLSFDKYDREKIIFENYLWVSNYHRFRQQKQFIKYGFFHIEKEREYQNYPSFFTRLIEQDIHKRSNIITIIGYLTDSKVLWDLKYDENGNYIGYTTEGGYGISDYWKEYFRGIKNLKKAKLSDLTLYRLNKPDSPYNKPKPDLIEIKMLFSKSNKAGVKEKSTTRFIDYALLISDSKANKPLEELK